MVNKIYEMLVCLKRYEWLYLINVYVYMCKVCIMLKIFFSLKKYRYFFDCNVEKIFVFGWDCDIFYEFLWRIVYMGVYLKVVLKYFLILKFGFFV